MTTAFVVALVIKASVLLAAALVAARLLVHAPARARHFLWSGLFAALLALPILAAVLPAVDVPVPPGWRLGAPPVEPAPASSSAATARNPAFNERSSAGIRAAADRQPTDAAVPPASGVGSSRPQGRLEPLAVLMIAWLAGVLVALGATALALFHVRALSRDASPLEDPGWREAVDAMGARLGLPRSPRLVSSPRVVTPMAGGVLRPTIFLPASAPTWNEGRRDIVLAHELVHLAGRDPLRHLLARIAVAFYWFHPLAWLAAQRAEAAREHACDQGVLALGTRPSDYARVLLDLADAMGAPSFPLGALPMVQRSHLEKRLMAILSDRARPIPSRLTLIPTLVGVVLTATMAAAHPVATAPPATPASQAKAVPAPAVLAAPAAAALAGAPHRPVPEARPAGPSTPAQTGTGRESACWWDGSGSFTGVLSMDQHGGSTEIREQVGRRGDTTVIQKSFDDLRLCMIAEGVTSDATRPSQVIDSAPRVVLEATRGGASQRLEIVRTGGSARTTWQVNGAERSMDAAARDWRDRMLAVLDSTWDLAQLNGQVSSLRGEISSIEGQRSSLQGQISSLRGEVSAMDGEISSVRGQASSLQGQISSIRGHLSSLEGAVSSERGAISSLTAERESDAADRSRIAARIAEHEAEIKRLEGQIRDYDADARVAAIQKQLAAFDADGKAAAIQGQIKSFDLDGKIAAIRRQIADLNVDGRTREIEQQIQALDVNRKSADLQRRLDADLARLRAAIAAIR